MNLNHLNSASGKIKGSLWQYFTEHPFLFYSLIHVIIFLGLFTLLNYNIYSDPGSLERWFALNILNVHELPYRDFITEYPPIAILSFIIPAIVFREPFSYNLALSVEMLVADLVIISFLIKFSLRLKLEVWKVLVAYSFFIVALGQIVTIRHDLIPAMLVMLTLYAFITRRNRTSWALLGIGIMTKLYPVILIPLFAAYYLFRRSYSDLIKGIIILMAVIIIIILPWLVVDSSSFLSFFSYHTNRGLQSESSYATVLLLLQLMGLTGVVGIFNFGSWNLSSPLADTLAALSPYLMVGCLLVVYVIYGLTLWRRKNSTPLSLGYDGGSVSSILNFSLLAILVLVLTNKVLSPQYLIWIAPLLAIYSTKGRYILWILFIVIGIFTQYVYPYNYGYYQAFVAVPVVVELLRNLGLLATAILIAWQSRLNYFSPSLT